MKSLKKSKILLVSLLVIMALVIVPTLALAQTPAVTIDGKQVSIAASYGTQYIDSANRLMVPIRVVSEKLGAKVAWDAKSQTAVINDNIKLKLGAYYITTPYGNVTMDTKAVVKNNRIYVPLKYVGNALGYKIVFANNSADIITKVDMTVSAAASLKDAMADIKALYLKAKPNTTLSVNLGASGTLVQQIEQGAKVDVFISASTANMDTLKNEDLLFNDTIKNLLGNKLVLVVPSDSTATITGFAGVTDASIKSIALGDPSVVPAGKYAEQVFTSLGILDQVKAKAVYGQDVKQVLSWVETGNADAGVVYATDAKVSTKVKVISIASEDSHKPIVYPAAMVKATTNSVAAQDFLNFLTSKAAKAVFTSYGFDVL